MKNIIALTALALFAVSSLAAQMTVSGILDSTVSMNAGAQDAHAFSYGIEEYANLRFQSRIRDRGSISGAVNFTAASGDYAAALAHTGAPVGENFIAAIELERLHFRLRGEHIDFDGGLFRLPFGYGNVWGPSDFLNPRNPLKPDARLRAILGAAFSWFPIDEIKLLGFYAAPRNALSNDGSGTLAGFSLDRHWDKASVQTLYSFETPKEGSAGGIHRAGLSLKADVEVGLVMDALYTYNNEAGTEIDGLSFSIGADYSFFDGNLILLAEYLYSGKLSSTSVKTGGDFMNNNYLSSAFTWRFNDFTNINLALVCALDDISFTPILSFNHELFQGATLMLSAQIPLDRNSLQVMKTAESSAQYGQVQTLAVTSDAPQGSG
ncbi:MAG: hypothetical protein FWD40_09085 [Treponema sp.]|nr:hypothetical protein [Treponema sp.]